MNYIKTSLLALFFCFVSALSMTAPPYICRIQGGNTKTIWGTGFNAANTEVYVWDVPFNKAEIIRALQHPIGKVNDIPVLPPKDAKRLKILSVDDAGFVMAVEFSTVYNAETFFDSRVSGQLIWIKNANGFSAPTVVQKIDPWWVYPQMLRPGEKLRIFGRNIGAKLMALKAVNHPEKTSVFDIESKVLMVRNKLYENELAIPDGLAPGDYELTLHNGAGGVIGWSKPIVVKVLPKKSKTENVYVASNFNVKGDGVSDDTKALKQLITAAARKGGMIVLSAGRYLISETLELPAGVSLSGAGKSATTLQVSQKYPATSDFPKNALLEDYANDWLPTLRNGYFPMVWIRDSSAISDLTLQFGPGVSLGILVAGSPGISRQVKIERVAINANQKSPDWMPAACVLIGANTYGLVISDNEFTGGGAIETIANIHSQAYIGRNKAVTIPTGAANTIFLRGMRESIVENNQAAYGYRTFSAQVGSRYGKHQNNGETGPGLSSYHVAVMGNVFEKNLTWRHNDGENMYESGNAYWRGKAKTIGKNNLKVEGKPFTSDLTDCYVLILSGKGIGQYRRVTSYRADELILDRDWDIQPDSSTYFVAGAFFTEHLWVDNTIDHNASWVGFWGNNLGHVMDGTIMRDCGDLTLWAWNDKEPSSVAFVDIIGSRNIGKGTITLTGSPVFGNTVRMCEVIGFRYRPDFHIDPVWLSGTNPNNRSAITIKNTVRFKGIPETAPLNSWNIIEANHIYDGPNGIKIDAQGKHTIIRKNAIFVDKEKLIHSSPTNYVE